MTAATRRRSATPKVHRANQSPPLMPAQPENPEQSTRDGRRFGNDRASQLDVVELGVSNQLACSSSPGEEESKREVWRVVGSNRDGETLDLWSAVGCDCGRPKSGPRPPSVGAVLNGDAVETTGDALNGETQGHVLIKA